MIIWTPLTLFWTFALKEANIFQICGYLVIQATIYLNKVLKKGKHFNKICFILYALGILLIVHKFVLGLIGIKI